MSDRAIGNVEAQGWDQCGAGTRLYTHSVRFRGGKVVVAHLERTTRPGARVIHEIEGSYFILF